MFCAQVGCEARVRFEVSGGEHPGFSVVLATYDAAGQRIQECQTLLHGTRPTPKLTVPEGAGLILFVAVQLALRCVLSRLCSISL